ncbi:MAG: hypothetical protein IID08_02820 [Candidatus Hydrogenedentes bacterium]|nr:hypothetical protein [Candidatus Hydrogenedentota bacterium]
MSEQLKVEVERIVEPVHAEIRLKNKFRQELWTHLSELYEEESASTPDSDTAAQRALERLGKPDELRAQLRDSMKLVERIEGFGAYWMTVRREVPLFREMLRLGFSSFCLVFGMILALTVGLWISPKDLAPDKVLFMVTLGISVSLIYAVFGAVYPWVENTMRKTAKGKKPHREFFKKALKWSALSALIMLASGFAAHFAGHTFLASMLGAEHRRVVEFEFVNPAIWKMLGGLVLITPPLITLGEVFFSGRLPDWPYADAE